ncbi:MAG: peptidase S8 [Gammaproteobacteria bacterium]|nr:peptidase S8 [Gammaproteobacteria bacterium]
MQFQPDLTPAERQRLIEQMGGELLAWLPALNTAQIRLYPDKVSSAVFSNIQQLTTDNAIVFAEADSLVQAAMVPNDPDITDQRKVYAPELLDLFAGWEYTRGDAQIVIAVLDSGISSAHPEFVDRLLPGHDFVQQDNDPEDENGHGTHVAGIVGARMDNGAGVAGICGECTLLPVRVLNAQNVGSWMNVAQGVIFAVEHGARVIVMSLGSTVYSQTMLNAIQYAQKQGVLVVAAAGNANSADPFYPAAFPGVLGVGATTRQDQRWAFSNYGQNVDIMAPGDAVYSTYLNKSGQGYQTLTGTSMAAPHVSGVIDHDGENCYYLLGINRLAIADTFITLHRLAPGLPPVKFAVNYDVWDMPLQPKQLIGRLEPQKIELKQLSLRSPFNPLREVAVMNTIFIHFSLDGLLAGRIDRVEVLNPRYTSVRISSGMSITTVSMPLVKSHQLR